MQEEIESWLAGIIMVCCLVIVISLAIICQQRDTIALQQQRIENYKNMLLKLPVYLRDEQGRKIK